MFVGLIGVKSEDVDMFYVDVGGLFVNICVGLFKLGSYLVLVILVFDDVVGWFCVNWLIYYGVDICYVCVVGGEVCMLLVVYESWMENFQNVIYCNGVVDFQVIEVDMDVVVYGDFIVLIIVGIVFVVELLCSVIFCVFEYVWVVGLLIIFDIDYCFYLWFLVEVVVEVLLCVGDESDLIVGNDEEFGFMVGGIDKGLVKVCDFVQKLGCIVIYKMGQDGVIIFVDG